MDCIEYCIILLSKKIEYLVFCNNMKYLWISTQIDYFQLITKYKFAQSDLILEHFYRYFMKIKELLPKQVDFFLKLV